ncbi:MAG: hypothetical protein OXI95_11955 [bacterium]|nr:hypothetical protein [bacterium]
MIALPEHLPLIATAVVAFGGIAALLLARRRRRYAARICRRWGLDPGEVSVLSSDLARHRSDRRLMADGLVGSPDVLFRDRRRRQIVVGEAKSRHYRGEVTPYERFQATLYCGMAHRLYRRPVTAILLYGNGRRVPLAFDEGLYRQLLARREECRRAMSR